MHYVSNFWTDHHKSIHSFYICLFEAYVPNILISKAVAYVSMNLLKLSNIFAKLQIIFVQIAK